MSVAEGLINRMCRFVMRTGAKIDGLVVDFSGGFLKVEVYRYIYELGRTDGSVFAKQDKTVLLSFEDISTIEIVKQWSGPVVPRFYGQVVELLKKLRLLKKNRI